MHMYIDHILENNKNRELLDIYLFNILKYRISIVQCIEDLINLYPPNPD